MTITHLNVKIPLTLSINYSVHLTKETNTMSTLQNEIILENLWDEVVTELKDNDTYALYQEWEIQNLVNKLFEDMCL